MDIQAYGDGDMSDPNYHSEIWIGDTNKLQRAADRRDGLGKSRYSHNGYTVFRFPELCIADLE